MTFCWSYDNLTKYFYFSHCRSVRLVWFKNLYHFNQAKTCSISNASWLHNPEGHRADTTWTETILPLWCVPKGMSGKSKKHL